jgi:hypothetical protein
MIQSITELQGYDYLIEWKQDHRPPQEKDDNPEQRKGTIITPSIVKGHHLVTEAPYLYRQFIENKYSINNLNSCIKRQSSAFNY